MHPWSPPVSYDLRDPDDARRLESSLATGEVRTVVDPIEHLAKGLSEPRYPDRRDDARTRSAFVPSILDQGPAFGRWWLFEWSGQLVRFPECDDLHALRTFRNRDLITAEEQRLLDAQGRDEDDWSITWSGCGCDLCQRLETFLASPTERTLEWPLAKRGRQHIHQQIDAAGLPVQHTTRRKGRPFTLVLEKTPALFSREREQRQQAERDLEWVPSAVL